MRVHGLGMVPVLDRGFRWRYYRRVIALREIGRTKELHVAARYIYICVYIYMYTYTYVCVHIYIYMYVYIYVYINVYMYYT